MLPVAVGPRRGRRRGAGITRRRGARRVLTLDRAAAWLRPRFVFAALAGRSSGPRGSSAARSARPPATCTISASASARPTRRAPSSAWTTSRFTPRRSASARGAAARFTTSNSPPGTSRGSSPGRVRRQARGVPQPAVLRAVVRADRGAKPYLASRLDLDWASASCPYALAATTARADLDALRAGLWGTDVLACVCRGRLRAIEFTEPVLVFAGRLSAASPRDRLFFAGMLAALLWFKPPLLIGFDGVVATGLFATLWRALARVDLSAAGSLFGLTLPLDPRCVAGVLRATSRSATPAFDSFEWWKAHSARAVLAVVAHARRGAVADGCSG